MKTLIREGCEMQEIDAQTLGYEYERSKVVEKTDTRILFSGERKKQERFWYELLAYDIQSKAGKVLHTYEIPEYGLWSQNERVVGDKIIIVKMHLLDKIEVEQLNRYTGECISKHILNLQEGEKVWGNVIFISNQYFIFNIDMEVVEGAYYTYYKDKKVDLYYLYDLEEKKSYPIRDVTLLKSMGIVHGWTLDEFPVVAYENKKYLLFNECCMEDYEYEEIYDKIRHGQLEGKWLKEKEALYFIALETFIKEIKNQMENISFIALAQKFVNGWVRYMGVENKLVYYREKSFETQIETIYKVNLDTLDYTEEYSINHKEIKGNLSYQLHQVDEEDNRLENKPKSI